MITILKAGRNDLRGILDLQYLAYQSEARLHNDPKIPPLTQTLDAVIMEYDRGIFLKAIDENRTILGSVRAYEKNGSLHIGKLIVHPEHQGHGIGTQLLQAIERLYPHTRYELFTSAQKHTQHQAIQTAGLFCVFGKTNTLRFTFGLFRKSLMRLFVNPVPTPDFFYGCLYSISSLTIVNPAITSTSTPSIVNSKTLWICISRLLSAVHAYLFLIG